MKAEHKAIMARAAKEGLLPSELAAELVVHDLVHACRAQMSRFEVGYNKMTEKQQDAVLAELQENFTGTAEIIGRILASAGTASVRMTCKDMKISNGTLTGIVSSDEQYFNQLISKVQDKSEVLVVLYEREYSEALDGIQSEKDQKSLPLDDSAPEPKGKSKAKAERSSTGSATSAAKLAAKAIELPPKLIEDARAFIIKQQVPNLAALQNYLKINITKAEALLKLFEGEGLIKFVGDEKTGQYEMVRGNAGSGTPSAAGVLDALAAEASEGALETTFHDLDEGDGQPLTMLTDDLYEKIKGKVIESGAFNSTALAVAFDLDLEGDILEQAADRLEMEGAISAMDELGNRFVSVTEDEQFDMG